ncbi:MAG: hypothetical protein LBD20_05895 [Spirochaetaceae bacterium]|nr:hypothetical protein [Spirochaetaceae bacterium]
MFILALAAAMPAAAQEAGGLEQEMRQTADAAAGNARTLNSGGPAQETADTLRRPEDNNKVGFSNFWDAMTYYFTAPVARPTRHLEPFTGFALGIGVTQIGLGFASDFPAGVTDILAKDGSRYKKNGLISIDFNKILDIPAMQDGVDFSTGFHANKLLSMEISSVPSRWGLGISAGSMDGRFDINVSREILEMLSSGIEEGEVRYGITVSGSLFAETVSVNWHAENFVFQKLFVSITGSHYIPVLYIPKSRINAKVVNKDKVEIGLDGTARVYMPLNVFNLLDGKDAGSMDWGGIDFSLQAEYALSPIFDMGITMLHIPFIPSALHASSTFKFDPQRNNLLNIDNLIDNDLKISTEAVKDYERVDGNDSIWIVRPMRVDFYALFRPARADWIVLRPNAGFTVFNPSEKSYFNIGLETMLNAGRIFTFSWFNGAYDGLWRNRIGFDLRLWKIARWFLDLEMRSQDYLGAWTMKGAAVQLGAKWGGGFNGVTNF